MGYYPLIFISVMLPTPPHSSNSPNPNLPIPPASTNSPKQKAQVNRAFAEYYWPLHFERNPVDPATFIDKLMTDYANYEPDVVGEWIKSMSPVYILYRACIHYGYMNGSPTKVEEIKPFQGVSFSLRIIELMIWLLWREFLKFKKLGCVIAECAPQEEFSTLPAG